MSPIHDWPGAKWWKFDFHAHSPISTDYGKGPNQAQLQQTTCKEWLLAYMRAGVDCVAVTDHNSGAWIDPLKKALCELQDEGNPDFRPLHLFPGVELSVYGGIHLLAVFDTDKSTADIDALLGEVRFRDERGESSGVTEASACDVINAITLAGGIAIPAHVDQDKGLFTAFSGTTLAQVLENSNVFAMEVIDSSTAKPQLYRDKKCHWAEVLGTDAHHLSGNDQQQYPGSRFTWVKMSKPSLDGLRLALIDGNLSIIRSDSCGNGDSRNNDPNAHGQLVLESLTVNQAKYIGRPVAFTCRLNPWFNAFIGGRGSGKSTLIEFFRIIFNRLAEIPRRLEDELAKYRQVANSRNGDGLLLSETELTGYLRKDGVLFRINWKNATQAWTIERQDDFGAWQPSEGDIRQRFPIRMYSQKQIFELARDHQALLHIIDDAEQVNFSDWKTRYDELQDKFYTLSSQLRILQVSLNSESVLKGQLEDVQRKIAVFEAAGHTQVLQEYHRRQNQQKAIDSWESAWADTSKLVRDMAEKMLPPGMTASGFDQNNPDELELIQAMDGVRQEVAACQRELRAMADKIDTIRSAWITRRPQLSIMQNILQATKAYEDYLLRLKVGGAMDPSEYAALINKKQQLEGHLHNISLMRQKADKLQQAVKAALAEILQHRRVITYRRQLFLQNILADNNYVKIEVIPFGNTVTVEQELRDLLEKSSGGYDRDINAILTKNTQDSLEERIVQLKDTIFAIYNNDASFVEQLNDRRFASYIQNLRPERLDRIQCWYPEDSLSITYSLNKHDSFKPVEQGSPGQKTAALLAFILSYGHEPLILDQPEDDLDNQLIYDLIVQQLRRIKKRRQVIVVTHNANIVVNGDAENVVVLEVCSGQSRAANQGGLQESGIRADICRLMEGGKEAFDLRYKRINAGKLNTV